MSSHEFTGELWRWQGEAAWFFVTLPHDVTDDIDESSEASPQGFGSRRVEVTVGSTTWRTSVFPDTKAASYLLPMKAAVRRSEGLAEGDVVEVHLTVLAE